MTDVAVIGGGPAGLAIAWRLAGRGARVRLFDPAVGSGAAYAAAGMLAPVAEAYFGEAALTRLLVAAAARWPHFAAELTAATGQDLGYRTDGTLIVALTADDLAEAERLSAYQAGLGLPVRRLRAGDLREREPLLAPRVRGGAYAPTDHQVDPRRLVAALRSAALGVGVELVPRAVRALDDVAAGTTVVAAGCGLADLTGLPVRPVKGQVLRLRVAAGDAPVAAGFRHVLRGYVDGRRVYLVPRADGEVVVGATVEERTDDAVTAGAVLDLLRAATDLVPELAEYTLAETCVRHRPGTPDNGPVLGPLPGRPGTLVAGGLYRHGIVLTPLVADAVAALVAGESPPEECAPFGAERFRRAALAAARGGDG
ncbi:MAG TPA: glycine oxidase ThiO [Pilimelia sp.]|nr:glycine oxidase ThiO [Pilimelia sp.]